MTNEHIAKHYGIQEPTEVKWMRAEVKHCKAQHLQVVPEDWFVANSNAVIDYIDKLLTRIEEYEEMLAAKS